MSNKQDEMRLWTTSQKDEGASEATTRGIRVKFVARYVPGRSAPYRHHYFFAYHIAITNEGDCAVQLVARHWLITNASGKTEEVRGPGVVGEQPHLNVGEQFKYTSFCGLQTPVGYMQGSFEMIDDSDEHFLVVVAPCRLALPYALN